MKWKLIRLGATLAVLGMLLGLTARFVVCPFLVVGDSMEPTLRSLDLCLMRRVRHYQAARGDIVMFRTADDPPLYFVKRVMALPGETLAIDRGLVSVDDAALDEPYAPRNPELELAATVVPPGKVYVIGDNRYGSLATLVATRLVTGRLIWHWRWKK